MAIAGHAVGYDSGEHAFKRGKKSNGERRGEVMQQNRSESWRRDTTSLGRFGLLIDIGVAFLRESYFYFRAGLDW